MLLKIENLSVVLLLVSITHTHTHTLSIYHLTVAQMDVQRLLVGVRSKRLLFSSTFMCFTVLCCSGNVSALQWTNITACAPDKMVLLAHILLFITQTVNIIIMNSKNEALQQASDMWGRFCLHHQSNWWLVIKPEAKEKNLFPGYWN